MVETNKKNAHESPAKTPVSNDSGSNPQDLLSSSDITQEEKILSALGYVSVACFLPLGMKPKSKFCQFHGKQGLVLFAISIIVLIFFAASPILGFFLFLAYFGLIIIAAFRAFNGEIWHIPVISMLTSKIDLSKIPNIPLGSSSASVPPKTEASPEPVKEEAKKEEPKHEEPKTKEEKK